MLNRRGFIGAMAGMPIAAVVHPKPEGVSPIHGGVVPSEVRASEHLPQVNITINADNLRPLTARDRESLGQLIGDALTARALRVPGR